MYYSRGTVGAGITFRVANSVRRKYGTSLPSPSAFPPSLLPLSLPSPSFPSPPTPPDLEVGPLKCS